MRLNPQSMLVTSPGSYLGMWCQFGLGGSTGRWFHSGTAGEIFASASKILVLGINSFSLMAASRQPMRYCLLRSCGVKCARVSYTLQN